MAMTEQEWLACGDPQPMLEFLRGQVSERKRRLFRIACCRQLWPLLPAATASQWLPLLTTIERAADEDAEAAHEAARHFEPRGARFRSEGLVVATCLYCEMHASLGSSNADHSAASEAVDDYPGHQAALAAACHATYDVQGRREMRLWDRLWHATQQGHHACAYASERKRQAGLLSHILGNPFCAVTIFPTWQTPAVISLAQANYDDRAFDRMPILAYALEDAGCDNADILNHCRQPGEHVRGCWVVDLVLEKE
jgi:hypothetical protein